MADNNVRIKLSAENATQAAFAAVMRDLNGLGYAAAKAAGVFGNVLGAFGVGFSALQLGEAILRETRKAEEAGNRLNAVLKATGHAAGLTGEELNSMAESMAAATQFDNTSIRNAASELLKFGNIQGNVFKESLALSADVAAFLGEDIPAAAAKLGKSLVDPETAFGLLRRSGVVLTEKQKDLVKALSESGDAAGAQKVILNELEKAFGGTASEMNSGITKSTHDLSKAWQELLETLGKTPQAQTAIKNTTGAITWTLNNIRDQVEDTRKADLQRFGLGGPPRRLQSGHPELLPPGGKMLLPDDITSEKLDAADAAREQKRKAADDAAYQRAKAAAKFINDFKLSIKKTETDISTNTSLFGKSDSEKEKAIALHKLDLDLMEKINQVNKTENLSDFTKKGIIGDLGAKSEEAKKTIAGLLDAQREASRSFSTGFNEGLLKVTDDATNTAAQVKNLFVNMFGNMENALVKFVHTGKLEFKSFANSVLEDLLRIAIQQQITAPLAGALFGTPVAGARAAGGPVNAGAAYLVGERGPEMFVPNTSGTIVPNSAARGAGMTVNVINQTSAPVSGSASQPRFDGEKYIVDVVLRNLDNNGPLRGAIAGTR